MNFFAPPPRLSELDVGRDNNLDFLRFVAATAVIYSHAYHILMHKDPLELVTGIPTGRLAVEVFFCLSGYLIAKSLVMRPDLLEFSAARALRIYPALWLANIVVVLFSGIFLTTLSLGAFFGSTQTYVYLLVNSSLVSTNYVLPGVFESNVQRAVNGSLWTLPIEMRMYAAVFFCGLFAWIATRCGMSRLRGQRVALWMVFLIIYVFAVFAWKAAGLPTSGIVHDGMLYLSAAFSVGVLAFLVRDWLPIDGRIAVALGAVLYLIRDMMIWEMIFPIVLTYFCLWLGFTKRINARGFSKHGDFSYGIYIYAFPIQQMFYGRWPAMHPLWNAGITFVIALLLAIASWKSVEYRALKFKKPLANLIRKRVLRQPAVGESV